MSNDKTFLLSTKERLIIDSSNSFRVVNDNNIYKIYTENGEYVRGFNDFKVASEFVDFISKQLYLG